jgi:hypothetical protein
MRIPFLLVASLALIIVGMIVFVVLVVIVPDAFAASTIAGLDSNSMTTPTPTPTPTPIPGTIMVPAPSTILSEPLDLTEETPHRMNSSIIYD